MADRPAVSTLQQRFQLGVIGLLALTNVLVLVQNVQLRERLSGGERPPMLEVGASVPPLQGMDANGRLRTIEYPDQEGGVPTLLLFFSPSCRYCGELFPSWLRLIPAARAKQLRVVGLVRAEEEPEVVADYIDKWGVSDLEVLYVDSETLATYGLYGTPVTFVVGTAGVVDEIWVGTWTPEDASAVGELFSIDFGT